MNTFPVQGITTTYDAGSTITDSASAATAIATGEKTYSGVISVEKTLSRPLKTFAEIARDQGWKTGIVSSVSISDATPAAFYAHSSSRQNKNDIALQLLQSNLNYFAGGEITAYPENFDSLAKTAGYTVVENRKGFDQLKSGADKVLVMSDNSQEDNSLFYAIDRPSGELSLADLTQKGIELLENPGGFFMMVEGGKIDWASHANDAAATFQEVLDLDAAVKQAKTFYDRHPNETLIIVTSDHETGGLSLGFSGTHYTTNLFLLQSQKTSFVFINNQIKAFKTNYPEAEFGDIFPIIQGTTGLQILSQEDETSAAQAVKAASAAGADDKIIAAGKAAQQKLDLNLEDWEADRLQAAYKASLKPDNQKKRTEEMYIEYGSLDPLVDTEIQILNQKAGISWSSFAHTGVPVVTSAVGVKSELFNGYYDNTDIFKKMMTAAGF